MTISGDETTPFIAFLIDIHIEGEMAHDLPVEFRVVDTIDKASNEPDDKGECGQVELVTEHHNVEAMLLMIIVHSCEE